MRTTDTRNMAPIMIAGGIVLALSFGVRSVLGGVIEPLSNDLFGGRLEIFSISLAIQNLVWGLAQPFFGMLADKFGDRRALWLGFLFYVLGMGVSIVGTTPFAQHMGAGVLVGMGISGTAFGTVLAVIGRAAPAEKRGFYLGVASATGSAGQALLPLLVAFLIAHFDWRVTMAILTALLVPMAFAIPFLNVRPEEGAATPPPIDLGETLRHAFAHPSFLMLGLGFFVCGFHLAFITAHLPTYVQNFCAGTGMTPSQLRGLGLQALALAGFGNIFGTLLAARLGNIFAKPHVLAAIYALRAVVILVFIWLPLTPLSVLIFGMSMGALWLSTVPLTSGLIVVMFGPRAMGTLFGFVFLSHQLGGFIGVWLGGAWFDRYGNYDMIWYAAIVLGLVSALVHLTVRERPAPAYA
ncbi:MFS transporter [Martelella limonii]|uniref:MFS transporter n=1 Tax=Martelella limonii TaxID=1647649 RepID=UPI0015807CDC|nr:MFS transporter [Martelella limonii]